MSYVIGIVVIVVGLLLSVAIHELGHMLPAKRFGVPVPVFSVGFGPLLWEKEWRGTRYGIRAIPLGGYVRIVGMYAPARPGTPIVTKKGSLTLAEEARRESAAEIPEGMEHRAFYRLNAPKKFAVMFGGPVTNLLLSVLLFAVVLMGIGVPTASPTLAAVPQTVTAASGEVPGPAAQAGIEAGDTLTAIASTPIESWADLTAELDNSTGEPVSVTFERGGDEETVTVIPVKLEDGRWVIGVGAGVQYVSASPTSVAQVSWSVFTGTVGVVTRLPLAVWEVATSLVTGAERDPAGVMSVVGVGRIAGEVAAGEGVFATSDYRATVATLLSLLASLNMALFVFNLIPVPPLDGGHIVGAIYEGIRRTVARLRQRPDPGPADTARLVVVTYVMGALLIGMSVILIVADIIKPVTVG